MFEMSTAYLRVPLAVSTSLRMTLVSAFVTPACRSSNALVNWSAWNCRYLRAKIRMVIMFENRCLSYAAHYEVFAAHLWGWEGVVDRSLLGLGSGGMYRGL